MNPVRSDKLLIGGLCLAISLAALPGIIRLAQKSWLVPAICLAVIAWVGLLSLADGLRGRHVSLACSRAELTGGALFAGYVLLLRPLGFYVASALFTVGISVYTAGGKKHALLQAAACAAGLLALVHGVFEMGLGVFLPTGALFE